MTDSNEAWRERLILTNTGSPKPLLANAITALREAPAWYGVLAYDQFAMETIVGAAPPWDFKTSAWISRAWSSHDDLLTAEWLQRAGPVLWMPELLSTRYQEMLPWNPFAVFVAIVRDPLLGRDVSLVYWESAVIFSLVGFCVSLPFLGRVRRHIVYWI